MRSVAAVGVLAMSLGGLALGQGACAAKAGDGGTTSGGAGGSIGNGGAGGSTASGSCLEAEGMPIAGSDGWSDAPHEAKVTIEGRGTCARGYVLSTTAPLRDGEPKNPRTVAELAGQPVLRTGHDLFDALYALAHAEAREGSVDAITNFAFNDGKSIPCAEGGCFETGRLWTYVWTRDTAYAVALGLGLVDPTRAKNSLAFKTSTRRDGTKREIVQDTGTGGSYPISSDRVVWALGARALLRLLDGDERAAFAKLALEAIANTAERDRRVVFDPSDGLYRGEQSFLDWREQTYPAWTATDTVQIGMSKALGTNVGHLVLLELAAELSTEQGDDASATTYAGWAKDLRAALRTRMWLPGEQQYSSFIPGPLDPAPVRRYDLLSSALAILEGVASETEAQSVVEGYPHLPKGAPVIWPQQQDVRIYHNRALWPFVTAFWAKAAAKVGHAAAVEHAVRSLVRGAALNLSNMENFEAASGAAFVDEGPMSGPVVNSQRQLWSVAGYLSMVHEVLFGLETRSDGLRFSPRFPANLRRELFGTSDAIALSNLRYRGKSIAVRLVFPKEPPGQGLMGIKSVRLDGKDVGTGFVDASMLSDSSMFEIELGPGDGDAGKLALLDDADVAAYRNVFGPRTPAVDGIGVVAERVKLDLSIAESPDDVTLRIYRDGVAIADDLPGTTTSFTDPESAAHASRTYCYTVEARFKESGNVSQRAKPACWWGQGASAIQTRDAKQFAAEGGTLVDNHGRWHFEGWGDPEHTLTVASLVAARSGKHFVQVLAGNGAGGYDTGITCGVKLIEVFDGAKLVGSGQLAMPHLGTWSDWRESSLVPVELVAGKSYAIVIREDDASGNMSDLEHFALYGGTGGKGGRFNRVNIAEVKLLAVGE
jgi:hypothetical protein